MNNEYMDSLRILINDFRNKVLFSGYLENKEMMQESEEQISENIEKLLSADKPKIMVYGIYNSGKSTLVNSICRKEVAEVGAKPTTDTITEYDNGPYILVDSPGVNAPIEHEMVAEKHLNGCHVILFVISSAGIFEDRMNYEKMVALINREIPFYIVLNERGAYIPPKEEGEEKRRKAIVEHEMELNNIKRKIIRNLVDVSGNREIAEKYEVIVVNAKRAWTGVEKNNEILVQKSNIYTLTNRLMSIIEGDGSIKQVFTPLVQFEQLVLKVENQLVSQMSDREFGVRRENLQTRISILQEEFFDGIYGCVSKHFEEIYRCSLLNSDLSGIWEDLIKEIEELYMSKIISINHYMKKAFKELSLTIDSKCNIINPQEIASHVQINNGKSFKNIDKSKTNVIEPKEKDNLVNRSFYKPSTTGDFLSTLLSLFKSKSKKEKEEYDRLCAEAESYNQQQQYLMEEELRRRQDARTKANALVDDFTRQIRKGLREDFTSKFNNVVNEIDNLINCNKANNMEVQKTVDECRRIREELARIKNNL